MSEAESRHWVDDPEILRRYIFGDVDEEERRSLEGHLSACAECHRTVEQERKLAMRVRAYGREQLKERLQDRLKLQTNVGVPWTKIVSAAAVVIVVVGLGVYNHWFLVEPTRENIGKAQEVEKGSPDDTRGPEQETKIGGGKAIADLAQKEKAAVAKKQFAPKRIEETTSGVKGEREQFEQPSAAQSTAGAGVHSLEKKYSTDELQKLDRSSLGRGAWVEGFVLPQTRKDNQDAGGAPVRQKAVSAYQREPMKAVSAYTQKQEYRIEQRPSEDLPAYQQRKQMPTQQIAIPTFVEQTNEGLRMTLYPDSQIPESELLKAQVQQISEDSVVVEFPQRRIGYKIPAAFLFEQGKKSHRK